MPSQATVVFGGNRIGNRDPFTPDTNLEGALKILAAHNITTIDSAQAYGNSQATIGEAKTGDRFTIDTKWGPPRPAGPPGGPAPGQGQPPGAPRPSWATREHIVSSAKDSIAKLGVQQAGHSRTPLLRDTRG